MFEKRKRKRLEAELDRLNQELKTICDEYNEIALQGGLFKSLKLKMKRQQARAKQQEIQNVRDKLGMD
jgi:hypothetical protein